MGLFFKMKNNKLIAWLQVKPSTIQGAGWGFFPVRIMGAVSWLQFIWKKQWIDLQRVSIQSQIVVLCWIANPSRGVFSLRHI